MRTIILILLFCFAILRSNSQAPAWQWAHGYGGIRWDEARDMSVDAAGNIYVIGDFESPYLTLGSITVDNANINGWSDVFVAKFDPNGNVIWAFSAGDIKYDLGRGICLDDSANVYITGSFSETSITFGNITLFNTVTNYFNVFVAKLDSSGNTVWAKTYYGDRNDIGGDIATDSLGNVYISGSFSSFFINFNPILLFPDSVGIHDIYIAKLDRNGNTIWAKSFGGWNYDYGTLVLADYSGNGVYLAGDFTSPSITFDTITVVNDSAGTTDIYVAKLNASGNVMWAKSFGGSDYEQVNTLAFDNPVNGAIIIAGSFASSSISFDSTTFINYSSGTGDMYFTKLQSNGDVAWATKFGGNDYDEAADIAVDASGNIYATGYFESTSINFDFIPLTNYDTIGPLTTDVFFTKLDNNGNAVWADRKGGNNNEWSNTIVRKNNGDLCAAGGFASSSISFGSDTLVCSGNFDVFIASTTLITENHESAKQNGVALYPNPCMDEISISGFSFIKKLSVYNIVGEKILSKELAVGEKEIKLEIKNFPAGIYIMKLQGERMNWAGKFVKE
jgi:Secretion system C-terminal sorting domain/Beta-propeller repeat